MKFAALAFAVTALGISGLCRADDVRPKPPAAFSLRPATTTESSLSLPQKVVLYEEDQANPNGSQFGGSAVWRTERERVFPDQKSDVVVRADIEIPEQKLSARLSLRRNEDKQLPASHTIEIAFTLPPDFAHGGISNIPGVLMKQGETTRGVPLNGVAVKVTTKFFLIGLSNVDTDMRRNIQLLRERSWIDIPVVYGDGRRAIIAIEKGTPGERAFTEAFAAWGTPASPPPIAKLQPSPRLPAGSEPLSSSLSPPTSSVPTVQRSLVPLQIEGGTFTVPVSINNSLTLNFVLDSGATDVSIPADVVLTLMRTGTLNAADFLGTKTYRLADGRTVPSQTFRIKSLKVGEKVLENVTGSVASVEGSLLLGQSFLRRFKSWSIDNQRQVLVLE
jgi:clan AA aspartic protease (TIGR02281 family)